MIIEINSMSPELKNPYHLTCATGFSTMLLDQKGFCKPPWGYVASAYTENEYGIYNYNSNTNKIDSETRQLKAQEMYATILPNGGDWRCHDVVKSFVCAIAFPGKRNAKR